MLTKKILKTFALATLFVAVGVGIAHAEQANPCTLITELSGVFKTLRTLAFVGAAFCVGGWAWGYISGGKIGDKSALDELKGKGIALLVGFFMLFGVGMILQFLPGIAGCSEIYTAFR